jgi:zinc D-Ala-D-Ala carboxypeptidase
MTKVSEHLSLKEVTKSNTAQRRGIDNTPTVSHLVALKEVAENIFEPLRLHFGVPIGVSSGYRGKELNEAIGGSKRSQHCNGQALDLDADIYGSITNADIFYRIKNHLDFDQLIWEFGTDEEPNWVHVSYVGDGTNRGEVLKAYRVEGRVKYKRFK